MRIRKSARRIKEKNGKVSKVRKRSVFESIAIVNEVNKQLMTRKGPYYERWLKGMRAAVEARSQLPSAKGVI
jgi:hypothetical protein